MVTVNWLIKAIRQTGTRTDTAAHENHIWHVDKVKALVAKQDEEVTFFLRWFSRNFSKFIDLFDGVFVLEVGIDTLNRRLDERPENEFGGKKTERELIVRLHQTKEDIPKNGIIIDATAPISSTSLTRSSVKAKKINDNDSNLRSLTDSPIHRCTWIRIVQSTALTRALVQYSLSEIINL